MGAPTSRAQTRLEPARIEASHGFTHGLLRGIVAVRCLAVGWAVAGFVLGWQYLTRPALAGGLLLGLAGFTAATAVALRSRPALLLRPTTIAAELALAGGGLLIDVHVYDAERVQSLVWAWPAAGIISASVAFGSRRGVIAAIGLGICSWLGDARNSLDAWGVSESSKTALYVLAAVIASYVTARLRQAENEVQMVRARDEVARTLHDGVLQTLAVIQRRSDDSELVDLARRQDLELRNFLSSAREKANRPANTQTLGVALRSVATAIRDRDGLEVHVIVADDLPPRDSDVVDALGGATQEALTNAAKHSGASRVTVFAEPDDTGISDQEVLVTINDNGRGFDTSTLTQTIPHMGISGSIVGRIEQVGGRATIRSEPGRGTEVQLWVP